MKNDADATADQLLERIADFKARVRVLGLANEAATHITRTFEILEEVEKISPELVEMTLEQLVAQCSAYLAQQKGN
jgi:hypothetical protein